MNADDEHGVIHVHIESQMPAELRERVLARSIARSMCRGFLLHCEDIMAETIGLMSRVEEFNDAVDMGTDVVQRLRGLGGDLTPHLRGMWDDADHWQDETTRWEQQADRWNGEADPEDEAAAADDEPLVGE